MKKTRFLFALLVCALLLVGCGSKKPITPEEFGKVMKEEGYTVNDVLNKMGPVAKDKVKSASLAVDKDRSHQIEFYQLADEQIAKKMFDTNKTIFIKQSPTKAQEETTNGNHSYYIQKSNGKVYVVSRTDDTLIYAIVNTTQEEQLNKIIKKLGY